MPTKIKLAFALGLILGFCALGALSCWLNGPQTDVPFILALGCAVSLLTLCVASSQSRRA